MSERFAPHLKIAYLLAVMTVVCISQSPVVIGALLVIQLGLWIYSTLGWSPLVRVIKRLALFFLIIALSYAFVSVGDADQWASVVIGHWKIPLNLGGLSVALIMCLRVFVLVLASRWVQESSKPGDIVRALQDFRVPRFLGASIDGTIRLAAGGGQRRGSGDGSGGGGRRQLKKEETMSFSFQQIRQGRMTYIKDMVERALDRAEALVNSENPGMDRVQARDIAIMIGIAVAIMGTKLVQVLPGIPIAPGHKNVLIVPLLLLAAGLTQLRFGGLWTGLTVGIVSVLSGYGQYGVLEIAHFAVPGLMADVLLPLVRPHSQKWWHLTQFALIGAAMGAGRFAANFLMILLAGAPGMAFVLYLPMFVSQVSFGAISAFVTLGLLDVLWRGPTVSEEQTASGDRESPGAMAGRGASGTHHQSV
ncbi:MAG TPA: energy-coupling factor transporter transmembrane component T [Nitrospira sp.]